MSFFLAQSDRDDEAFAVGEGEELARFRVERERGNALRERVEDGAGDAQLLVFEGLVLDDADHDRVAREGGRVRFGVREFHFFFTLMMPWALMRSMVRCTAFLSPR
jgi:hypothetical protein